MVREEDFRQIGRILASSDRDKKQRQSLERLTERRSEDLEQRRIAGIQQQIRVTGAVDLLEGVCKKRLIRLSESSREAPEIVLDRTIPRVFVNFNYRLIGGESAHDHVEARIEGGVLCVCGEERYVVGGEMTVPRALGLALAGPEVVINRDRSLSPSP